MKPFDGVIRTKLNLPGPRPGLVSRPHLKEIVTQGLKGPLTLIAAPAGFGKTTLIASCAADCDMPVAWLSLDRDDNQPGRFLTYLIASLNSADPRAAEHASQLLSESQQLPPEAFLTSIINDLDSLETDIILVLDDYQVITSQAVNEGVTFLIEHCPGTLHLVIASRSDPPLPIARLRARGQLVELRSADLRFLPMEAAQFLHETMGLSLDEQQVAVLEERTEGWIAGLQMAALSMHGHRDLHSFIENFSGTNRYILDYLLEEVLSSQPPEIQHFLLCTSILERLTAPLCDAAMGMEAGQTKPEAPSPWHSSASILEYLERTHLFLMPLDDERRWYRYHHLFADLLRVRLAESTAFQNQNLLHERASAWFEQNGLAEEAIRHSLAAGNISTAARQVESAAENAWITGRYGEMIAWTKVLPIQVVQSHPRLCIWNAWAQSQTGDVQEMRRWIEVAKGSIESVSRDREALADEIAALEVFAVSFSQEYDRAIALAETVLKKPPFQHPAAYDFIRCNLLHLLSSMYYGTGQLEQAERTCRETIDLADQIGLILRRIHAANKLILIQKALGRLARASQLIDETQALLAERGCTHYFAAPQLAFRKLDLLYERNHLDEAQRLLDWASTQPNLFAVPYLLVDFYNLQACIFLSRQNISGAQYAIDKAAALARQTYIWEGLAWRTEALQIRLWLQAGDLQYAEAWINHHPEDPDGPIPFSSETRMLARVRVLLAGGRFSDAIPLLDRLCQAAESDGRNGSQIEIHILRSIAWQGKGDQREAAREMGTALTLAEPEGYMRVFLDEGRPVETILAHWRSGAAAGRLKNYAAGLLAQFDSIAEKKPSPNSSLIEPLSPRELEVLQMMSLGQTNQQIADHLIVARGTVKAQAASIFRKLDVSNRTEAVARARELGILS